MREERHREERERDRVERERGERREREERERGERERRERERERREREEIRESGEREKEGGRERGEREREKDVRFIQNKSRHCFGPTPKPQTPNPNPRRGKTALRQTRGFDQNPRVWRNVGFAPPPAGRRGFPGKPAGLVSRSFEIAFPERVLKKRMVWSYVGFC